MKRHQSLRVVALTALIVFALTSGVPVQSNAEVLGTLPSEGAMIAEVSTETDSYSSGQIIWSVLEAGAELRGEMSNIILPLPGFQSGGVAEFDECMWIVESLAWELDFADPQPFTITSFYSIQGSELAIEFLIELEGPTILTSGSVSFNITAVAIRTTPPTAGKSVSFGEIKSMFRN